MGRPSSFTQEIADQICERIASGEILVNVCNDESLPTARTVFRWLADPLRSEFCQQYAHAKEVQLERMADEILSIADDSSADITTRYNEKGDPYEVTDHDHINRSRLRVDSRKWLLSKLIPKKYGDATLLKHADPDGNKLEITVTRVQSKKLA